MLLCVCAEGGRVTMLLCVCAEGGQVTMLLCLHVQKEAGDHVVVCVQKEGR